MEWCAWRGKLILHHKSCNYGYKSSLFGTHFLPSDPWKLSFFGFVLVGRMEMWPSTDATVTTWKVSNMIMEILKIKSTQDTDFDIWYLKGCPCTFKDISNSWHTAYRYAWTDTCLLSCWDHTRHCYLGTAEVCQLGGNVNHLQCGRSSPVSSLLQHL